MNFAEALASAVAEMTPEQCERLEELLVPLGDLACEVNTESIGLDDERDERAPSN